MEPTKGRNYARIEKIRQRHAVCHDERLAWCEACELLRELDRTDAAHDRLIAEVRVGLAELKQDIRGEG